jgi:hypothetical protein
MVIKGNNIFYSKALQVLPKSGFWVWKQTIWQPWSLLLCRAITIMSGVEREKKSEKNVVLISKIKKEPSAWLQEPNYPM